MTIEYVRTFWHEYNGVLLAGPNEGKTLRPGENDTSFDTEEKCIAEAKKRASMIQGSIRCYWRQFSHEKGCFQTGTIHTGE